MFGLGFELHSKQENVYQASLRNGYKLQEIQETVDLNVINMRKLMSIIKM